MSLLCNFLDAGLIKSPVKIYTINPTALVVQNKSIFSSFPTIKLLKYCITEIDFCMLRLLGVFLFMFYSMLLENSFFRVINGSKLKSFLF